MTSFFLAGAIAQVKQSPTMKLHEIIDWSALEKRLVGLYKREASHAGGPIPYEPLSMFKLMPLGQWHHLSDAQLEQALKVRLDFLVFCGFDLGAELPDHTTICRFRNRLLKPKLDESSTSPRSTTQLAADGLKVNEGARSDHRREHHRSSPPAPIARSRSMREGKAPWPTSADPDARWVKKGKHAIFGYPGLRRRRPEDGFIDTTMTRPANESETGQVKKVVRRLPKTSTESSPTRASRRRESNVSEAKAARTTCPAPRPRHKP